MYPEINDSPASSFSFVILKKQLLRLALFNLFIVALLGLILRSYSFAEIRLDYKNLLHGHSHFAFGGWAMPILLWLIMQYFPELKIPFRHWRNIVVMTLFSAYGMLVFFPIQGYGAVSIIFSTISVLAGFYLALVTWKATTGAAKKISIQFLRAGLFYLVLSSIGPFATGPLIAMGKAGSALYFNAIYFYLHFQYNGWFSFAILAVFTRILEENNVLANGNKAFLFFHLACAPAYFLSTLWNHPSTVFYFVGGMAALLQLTALFFFLKDFRQIKTGNGFVHTLMTLAMTAFAMKIVLQLLSALPAVADLAFANRNFIIAYLHLVLLGFISLSTFAFVLRSGTEWITNPMKAAIYGFIFSLVSTELLLVFQAGGLHIFSFSRVIFYCSLFFPLSVITMLFLIYRRNRKSLAGKFQAV